MDAIISSFISLFIIEWHPWMKNLYFYLINYLIIYSYFIYRYIIIIQLVK